MEYTIIDGFEAEQVTAAVNRRLKEGWELHGSLAVIAAVDTGERQIGYLYAQAMTKKTPEHWSTD